MIYDVDVLSKTFQTQTRYKILIFLPELRHHSFYCTVQRYCSAGKAKRMIIMVTELLQLKGVLME